jgi:hypothetical protein
VIERNALANSPGIPVLPDSIEMIRVYCGEKYTGLLAEAYAVPGSAAEAFVEQGYRGGWYN